MTFAQLFRRLRKEPTALIGLFLLLLFFVLALLARWISPFDPLEQHIVDSLKFRRLRTENIYRSFIHRIALFLIHI